MTEAAGAVAVMVVVMLTSLTTPAQTFQSLKNKVEAKDVNNFGLEIVRSLATRGNTLISPISLWSSMALTLYGAKLLTQEEMAGMLNILYVPRSEIPRFLDSVEHGLSAAVQDKDNVMVLETKIFQDTDYPRIKIPTDMMSRRVQSVNITNPEETSRRVNEFIKEATHNLIASLVDINKMRGTVMSMSSGACFKSDWLFEYDGSCSDAFFPVHAQPTNVTMMWVRQRLPEGMVRDLKARVVRLPFSYRLSLYLLLPEEEGEGPLEETLNALKSETLLTLKNLHSHRVKVSVPRVGLAGEYRNDLKQELGKLGSVLMFDSAKADFSYFKDNLYAAEIRHTASLVLNEGPIGAGMASNVALKPSSMKITRKEGASRSSFKTNVNLENDLSLKKDYKIPGSNTKGRKGAGERAQCERDIEGDCHSCLNFNRPFVYMLVDDVDEIIWQVGVFKATEN